jgi:hypothetical protein
MKNWIGKFLRGIDWWTLMALNPPSTTGGR